MNPFITYLLESSLCLFCFYSIYFLLLKNETWFQMNRAYLLLTIVCSLLLPLFTFWIEIPILTEENNNKLIIENGLQIINNNEATGFNLYTFLKYNSSHIFIGIYSLGIFISLSVFIKSIFQIIDIYEKGRIKKDGDITHVITDNNIGIFSFFNYIFLDENKYNNYSNEEKERILNHEKAHIYEKHSLDLMLLEILKIIFWFNPIIYIYKISLQQLHEYIADDIVIKKEGKIFEYAQFLVSQTKEETRVYNFCNNLFHEPIKSRLMMMKKTKSRNKNTLKLLFTIPVLAGLMFFLCIEYAFVSPEKSMSEKENSITENLDTFPRPSAMPLQPEKGKCYAKCMMPEETLFVDMEYPVFTGGDETGVDIKTVDILAPGTTKWVKKQKEEPCYSENPDDCMVWILVESGSVKETIKVVQNIDETDKYELKTFKVGELKAAEISEWQEVLCANKITKDFIFRLQMKLISNGYELKTNREMDKETKSAIQDFQEKNKLPKGNLNIQTLRALGLDKDC